MAYSRCLTPHSPPWPTPPVGRFPSLAAPSLLDGLGASAPIAFPGAPRRFLDALKGALGLGSILDANPFSSAWYLPLVERLNTRTGARTYTWGQMKYLSNWDALNYNGGFMYSDMTTQQQSTLYQWDGSQWRKTTVQSIL